MSKKSVVLIVGPTASGKSDLALSLAQKFDGVILNCDSLQFYQRLDIGTAKPSQTERGLVPHFLFDHVPPGQVLTAGDFRRQALAVVESSAKPVFAVGGSGFYIQAFEKGMYDVPKPSVEAERRVRERLESQGIEALHHELLKRDPAYGQRVHANDAYRITRALILMDDCGRTVTEVRKDFQAQPFPFPLLKLGCNLDREQLLPRVQARTEKMLKAGLVDEVKSLLSEGWADWPPLQSVGYKECIQFLKGEIPEGRLLELIVEKTMQLAKKQRTWFQREKGIHWLSEPTVEAEALVRGFLDRL